MNRKGFTLLEVVVSLLLTAIMISAVMSVALSARRSGAQTECRIIADQASRDMMAMLRNFVTADPAATAISGPGNQADPANRWKMDGYDLDGVPGGTTYADDQGSVYALATGTHTITNFLPSWFSGLPCNATIKYYVAYPQAFSVANGTMPWVSVTVDWAGL